MVSGNRKINENRLNTGRALQVARHQAAAFPQIPPGRPLIGLVPGSAGRRAFYVGKTGSAIGQLVCSLSVIGLLVSIPWALIDLIMIAAGAFRDGEGLLIRRWESRQ
jgi:TM2 domain-containing membrane protein YozV